MRLAFTIATVNYMAQALTIGKSYLAHNPADKFVVYLFDRIGNRFDKEEFAPIELVEVDPDWISGFDVMLKNYTLFELITAIKPALSLHAIKSNPSYDSYIFLDSDMLVYSDFGEVDRLFSEGFELIISTHFFEVLPKDSCYPDEKTYFNCGIYNAGFMAFKNGGQSIEFLNWWMERLKTECVLSFEEGLFYEQIWLNLVPLHFDKSIIVKHMGYNVGYWNLHERDLQSSLEKGYKVNIEFPLVFFHFSGFAIDQLESVSTYQNRYSFVSKPVLLELFRDYSQKVFRNGYARFSVLACYYAPLVKQSPKRTFMKKVKSRLVRLLLS